MEKSIAPTYHIGGMSCGGWVSTDNKNYPV